MIKVAPKCQIFVRSMWIVGNAGGFFTRRLNNYMQCSEKVFPTSELQAHVSLATCDTRRLDLQPDPNGCSFSLEHTERKQPLFHFWISHGEICRDFPAGEARAVGNNGYELFSKKSDDLIINNSTLRFYVIELI